MAEEKLRFEAEVTKLLDLVVHSLYSNKDIFLRELVSNASDACDKLRYAGLTEPGLLEGNGDFRITLQADKTARTLTITDNGVGMNRDDLIENLGTIARSGTSAFLDRLSGDARKDVSLIGQFGVGFYSAFMVASAVDVYSRKAGEHQGWRWASDGLGSYSISESDDAPRGTRIVLHLRDGEDSFLESHTLRRIIKTYSDHIALPVVLTEDDQDETVNAASALWTRNKSEVTAEQYKEFYHHVAHAFDEPWLTLHYRAEGAIEYTSLLFVPKDKPFDLFHPDRKQHIKLYVRRVFITDDCSELLPPYLRFVRGVVDSQDLPLNVSREMLQHNPVLAKIRSGLVKRILGELKKKATAEDGDYLTFWNSFGPVLKEGLYEDFERRTDLLELVRVRTTLSDEPVALATVLGRMKDGQDALYYMTGDSLDALKRSPQLEGFRAKGVEVMLLTDPVDEFWTGALGTYQDKPLKSVAQGQADLSGIQAADGDAAASQPEAAAGDELSALIAAFKLALKETVKDIRTTDRLTESPVCLVGEAGDVSLHLQRLLRAHQQAVPPSSRILEINPRHALIRRLADQAKTQGASDALDDAAWLLYDQARIVEGETLEDPSAFARRLSALLTRAV